MAGVEQFVGKWKQYNSENMEEFLKEMGANFMMRKVAKTANPEMTIELADGVLTFTTSAGFMKKINKLQAEGDSQMEDDEGVMMNYTSGMEDNKLVTTQEPVDKSKRKKVTVHREIIDGELLQTMFIGDIVCKRWFKRLG